MQRSEERILTTHVGSLIRPPELGAENAKRPDRNLADACLREAVTEVVARQSRIGLDIVSDGEYGKSSWATYILERVSGFEVGPTRLQPVEWLGRDRERFAEFFAQEMPHALTACRPRCASARSHIAGTASVARAISEPQGTRCAAGRSKRHS